MNTAVAALLLLSLVIFCALACRYLDRKDHP